MARLGFSRRALGDLERILDFHAMGDPELAKRQLVAIREAVSILDRHPLIGRPVAHGLRELVISRGKTGFVALYRFSPRAERVTILRVRHQRELGYPS